MNDQHISITKAHQLELRATRLEIHQFHVNFHENFETYYINVKYCEVNKENNFHIANST
jgi:hypothetical protein